MTEIPQPCPRRLRSRSLLLGLVACASSLLQAVPCARALSFESWSSAIFADPLDGLPQADPDGDELPNLVEWYCGLDPTVPGVPPVGITEQAGQLMVWFERSAAADAGLGRLESSVDLSAWAAAPVVPQLVSVLGGMQRLEMVLPASAAPRFFRLAVALDGFGEEGAELAYWDFEDGGAQAGESFLDGSGGGSDGVLKNGAVRGDGIGGSAGVVLDGVDDYLAVPLTDRLALDAPGSAAREFTLAAWVRLDPGAALESEDDDYGVLVKGSWTKPPFVEFGLRGGVYRGLFARIYDSSGVGQAHDLLVPSGDIAAVLQPGGGAGPDWHHVAFSRDASGVGRLFLDGHLLGERRGMASAVDPPASAAAAAVDGAESPLDELWIGRRYSRSGSFFRGAIDAVRVWRTALGEAELVDLVASQSPAPAWVGWAGFPPPDPQGMIFVAPPPLGDDSHDGTESQPMATIGAALDAAHDATDGRSHIFVRHGEYREGIDRVVNGDAPLSDRRPGELYIARPGITLEAEPWDGGDGRVTVKGSVTKSMDPGHPHADKFPIWQGAGASGLFVAERNGRSLNPQAMYLGGERLEQYGEANLGVLTVFWKGKRTLGQNDPNNLPERGFYAAEKLKLVVPASGGAAISDGAWFSLQRGGRQAVIFEFNERDDYLINPARVTIPFSNGRDVFGVADGSGTDTQAEIVAKILTALASPQAAGLALEGVADAGGGVIDLGARSGAAGLGSLALLTSSAAFLSSYEFELFVRLPAGVDPNAVGSGLEVPYMAQLLAVRAPGTKVNGFRFMHNNVSAISSGAAVLVNAPDVLLEDNEVLWCDVTGVATLGRAGAGLRRPVERLVMLNNRFSHCGNSGFGGTETSACRFVGNDTSGNNWRRYDTAWHAGGFKLNNLHHSLVIQGHTARYNFGDGLWFDTIDARHRVLRNDPVSLADIGVHVSESVAELNERSGFFYEISRNGEFFDNVSRYNRHRGFYNSNSSDCLYERNLAAGNGQEGFGFISPVLLQSESFFSFPRAHPLANNWSNTNVYAAFGNSSVRLVNNIIRNNALHRAANHDVDDLPLAARAPWAGGQLPTHAAANFPLYAVPGDTGAASPVDQAPLLGAMVAGNASDRNVLWRTGEAVIYGQSPSQYLNLAAFEAGSQLDGPHLDLKDLDRSTDGAADRVRAYRYVIHPAGQISDYRTFPSELAIDQNSVVADRFEFLDLPGPPAGAAGASVLDPDLDGDGMLDWWEAVQGLDPRDATGIHGADGDADGDGRTNLAEFENWKSGLRYQDLETFLQETDPTYFGAGRNGGARDLDGDKIPDLWEVYYGIGGMTGDEVQYLDDFRRGRAPGALAADTDADGLPDGWELLAFGDLDETAAGDSDGDGFSNEVEFRYWTLPDDPSDPPDKDADGLSDLWEESYGLDKGSAVGADGGEGDADGDGVSNVEEFRAWSDPRQASSVPGK